MLVLRWKAVFFLIALLIIALMFSVYIKQQKRVYPVSKYFNSVNLSDSNYIPPYFFGIIENISVIKGSKDIEIRIRDMSRNKEERRRNYLRLIFNSSNPFFKGETSLGMISGKGAETLSELAKKAEYSDTSNFFSMNIKNKVGLALLAIDEGQGLAKDGRGRYIVQVFYVFK